MENDVQILNRRYPALERLAVGLTATLFLLSLVSRAVRWDWLFDTAYLAAGAFVAWDGSRAARAPAASASSRPITGALLISFYLFIDSAQQMLVGFCFPGAILLVYLILTGLYGAALAARLNDRGTPVRSLPWGLLFRPPALYPTLAVLVMLGCLYMPMLHFYLPADLTVPPWLTMLKGNMAVVHEPHVIRLGSEITYRGVEVAFSRGACVLLAGIGVAHLLRIAALVPALAALRFMRAAALAVGGWWLVPGRGYHSLDNMFDLIFVVAYGSLLYLLFARTKEFGSEVSR